MREIKYRRFDLYIRMINEWDTTQCFITLKIGYTQDQLIGGDDSIIGHICVEYLQMKSELLDKYNYNINELLSHCRSYVE